MRSKNEKGASAVEFALVLPLLLVLVFGIIEFGVLIYDKAMITNASREAARAGIAFDSEARTNSTSTQLQDVVDTYCGTHLVTFGGSSSCAVSTNPSPTALTSGDYFTVTVRYQYDFLLTPAFITDLAGGIELVATTTMRAE